VAAGQMRTTLAMAFKEVKKMLRRMPKKTRVDCSEKNGVPKKPKFTGFFVQAVPEMKN
jgi:hypothetical protein